MVVFKPSDGRPSVKWISTSSVVAARLKACSAPGQHQPSLAAPALPKHASSRGTTTRGGPATRNESIPSLGQGSLVPGVLAYRNKSNASQRTFLCASQRTAPVAY
eukprot:GHVH01015882.1.p1 GENE.GHVH01015882.1~~GHVH01015882.1.p1  ORF type:complete len:105 (-),score=4.79 GHVH01015882.1:158-472(-)